MRRTDDREMPVIPHPFNFVPIFVGVQSTFMTADELLQNLQTDSGRPLPVEHSSCSVTSSSNLAS